MDARRILVADDDTGMLAALDARLRAEGFEVQVCQDAYQAVSAALHDLPDLMLLDINLPAGNGFSVRERLAKSDVLRKVPVIYITGESAESVEEFAAGCGDTAREACVVHKPFDTNDLIESIRAVLGEGAKTAEASDAST